MVLDGKQYPLPHPSERDTGELGLDLSWGRLGLTPSISIETEQDLLVGLLVLAYLYVRMIVIQG